jgi:molecular chaperone DnaJ
VFLQVKEHALFHRDGANLICKVPITYPQAALGAQIEVPTLEGPHELEVPRGTQTGEIFRLRGYGMPDPHGRGVGDLIVQVNIEVPDRLSSHHEDLLRQLAEEEHTNVSQKRKSFFKSLKDYFVAHESTTETED